MEAWRASREWWGWLVVLAVSNPAASPAAEKLLPWQDDANLHDVQFVGSRSGFAVGDQGIVWRTEDSGATWEARPLAEPVMLRSASFLTDRLGWVAGTRWQAYTGLAEGVLYTTADGGLTWEQRGPGQLPALVHVRFFSPDEGIVVGAPTAQAGSGVYRTQDGGHTWQPIAGEATSAWQVAAFPNPETGIVAGREGQLSLVGGDQLLASRLPPLGSRSIRGAALRGEDNGWVVGEGALVLTTDSGGVVWAPPAGALPEGLRDVCDFRAVEARQQRVWLAGSPGSIIWSSADAGQTWRMLRTGQTLPINKLKFVSDAAGFAVGELGVILGTVDGGETWQALRGAQRRAGWLALIPEPRAASLELAVHLAAEEGYRGVLWAASYPAPVGTGFEADVRDQLAAAAHTARANVAGVSWQLPVDRPDLRASGEALMQRWQNRAEQRAPSLLVEELVRQIRTYRPDVVVLPVAPEGNSLADFIQQAGRIAVEQAADPTRGLAQQDLAALTDWKVSRVLTQLPPGSQGDVTYAPEEFLPRLGDSLRNQTEPALSVLAHASRGVSGVALRRAGDATADSRHAGGVFGGMDVPANSPTRRPQLPLNERDLEAQQRRVQTQRNFRAITDRSLNDARTSAQLIGQLPDVLRELTADQAAVVMSDLARSYRQRSQYEHAESTYLELVRRHGQHPAAVDAMTWLLQYWSSSEVVWQRTRDRGQVQQQLSSDPAALQSRIQQAGGTGSGFLAAPRTFADVIPTKATTTTSEIGVRRNAVAGAPPDEIDQWRRRALELAQQLQQQSPLLFHQPQVQFPLAALKRATKAPGQADEIYRKFQHGSTTGSAGALVEQELWVTQGVATPPRHLALCLRANGRPHLDGVLSDACWREVKETPFGPAAADLEAPRSGFVMFAYDDEYLYVAAVVKRSPAAVEIPQEVGDRDYDADLTGQDRLGLALDVDRDYSTWYEFQVDARGQTSDRCWEDATWNPQWYVARDIDAERWQLELAIPWQELTPAPPQPRDVWGVSLVRTLPHEGYHGWTPTAVWPPTWQSFGLLRFQ